MDNRRGGSRSGTYFREDSWNRSQNRKPPRGSWQPKVPSWEKRFCQVVGSLDWETILEMKRFSYLYDNVVKWDDSAGEEAFRNAKKRFWANMKGLPCDLPLPDPDLYIDEVDWDSKTDPNLLLDLEQGTVDPDVVGGHDRVVIFGDSFFADKSFSASGWGADDSKLPRALDSSSKRNCGKSDGTAKDKGWGDFDFVGDFGDNSTGWNQSGGVTAGTGWEHCDPWGDFGDNSTGWNQSGGVTAGTGWEHCDPGGWEHCDPGGGWEHCDNGYDVRYNNPRSRDTGGNDSWQRQGADNWKMDNNVGSYVSSYRSNGAGHNRSYGWKSGKGWRGENFARKQSNDMRPLQVGGTRWTRDHP